MREREREKAAARPLSPSPPSFPPTGRGEPETLFAPREFFLPSHNSSFLCQNTKKFLHIGLFLSKNYFRTPQEAS